MVDFLRFGPVASYLTISDTATIAAVGADYTVTLNRNKTLSGFTLNADDPSHDIIFSGSNRLFIRTAVCSRSTVSHCC